MFYNKKPCLNMVQIVTIWHILSMPSNYLFKIVPCVPELKSGKKKYINYNAKYLKYKNKYFMLKKKY